MNTLLHQDEHNEVIMMNDGDLGVVIHLVTLVKRLSPNSERILEEHLLRRLDETVVVHVRTPDGKLKAGFKDEVKAAIKKCETKLIELQQNRQAIEGAIKDYVRKEN